MARGDLPLDLDMSILIATYGRADSLARTLESMAQMQTGALNWELVVVDNASPDRTPEVLRSFAERLPLRCFRVEGQGQNRARNAVLPVLMGRLTVLSDDDVCVAKDWLSQWKLGTDRWPGDAIFGGRIAPRFPDGCADWLRAADFPFRGQCFAEFCPRQDEGPYPATPFGPNFAIRTSVLRAHAFRTDLGPAAGSYAVGGETELVNRLKSEGMRVIYLPGPIVEHVLAPENLTLEKLCQRGFNAGRGDEYRRAIRRRWRQPMLWLRSRLLLPAKLSLYALLNAAAAGLPMRYRFGRLYKYHAARGRMHQLRLLLLDLAAK